MPAAIISWREHCLYFPDSWASLCISHISKTSLYIHSKALQSRANKNQQANKTCQVYSGSSLFTENHIQKQPFRTIAGYASGKPSKLRCKGISWSQHSVCQHLVRALCGPQGHANNTCVFAGCASLKGWPMGGFAHSPLSVMRNCTGAQEEGKRA